MPGKLILLPNLLDEEGSADLLPKAIESVVPLLQGLIGESEKSARRYLRRFLSHEAMKALPLEILNEHSEPGHLQQLLAPLELGETWGLISDAGLPCVADPGSNLVWLARQKGIAIQSLPGPSSLILALQLSGFTGQRFAFHGYLPREQTLLEQEIAALEKRALQEKASQIWIEAPYRSAKMLEFLKEKLRPSTRLCVAVQLTTPHERVVSLPVSEWRKRAFVLEKEPTVFLIDHSQ